MSSSFNLSRYRLSVGARDVVLTIGLWFSLIRLPVAPGVTLDPSWQEVLIRAHTQAWQFGRDIIFTYGPWGFLLGTSHLGQEAAGVRLAWEFAGQLLLAVGFVVLIRDLARWRQIGLVAAVAFFHPIYLVFITLGVIRGLMSAAGPTWGHFFWAVVLGFLCQLKLTYTVVAVCGLAAGTGLAVSQRRWLSAAAMLGGGGTGFLATWLAAGQSPGNLWAYAHACWEIILGNEGQALAEPPKVFLAGVGVSLLAGVFLWKLLQQRPVLPERLALVPFLATVWLVAWKHGYTRADFQHSSVFFVVMLYLGLLLPGFYFRVKDVSWLDGGWALCLVILLAGPFQAWEKIAQAPARWLGNAWALTGVARIPARWQSELEAVRGRLAFAELPAIVGSQSIDAFNFNQAELVLRPLNYAPRPVFQGYLASTARLIASNREYYDSARAPEFILWQQVTIDGRYPTQDDAGLFPLVRRRYGIVGTAGDAFLLKKRPLTSLSAQPATLLVQRTLVLGEICVLPPVGHDRTLWLRTKLVHSLLGRARALAYKPPEIYLKTEDPVHGNRQWRILQRVAGGDGFLLQPLVETRADFAAYMAGQPSPAIRQFSFVAPKGQEIFWRSIEVEITTEPVAAPAP